MLSHNSKHGIMFREKERKKERVHVRRGRKSIKYHLLEIDK